MSNPEVAKTIMSQINTLDRWAFGAWGARQFVYGDNFIQFKCSGTKIKRGGIATIELDYGKDLYNIKLQRVYNFEVTTLNEIEGIYADQLVEILDSYIG